MHKCVREEDLSPRVRPGFLRWVVLGRGLQVTCVIKEKYGVTLASLLGSWAGFLGRVPQRGPGTRPGD